MNKNELTLTNLNQLRQLQKANQDMLRNKNKRYSQIEELNKIQEARNIQKNAAIFPTLSAR